MWKEEDEYYDNIQDIENLIQREMLELNKMQEVVKQKRTTLNEMGVKIDLAKIGEEDLGLLEVLNDKGTHKEQGLKSPIRVAPQESHREGALKGAETGGAFSQGMNYRFGRPKTPDLLIKNQQGGVNFLGKNKEQINQISQKNKLEKEEKERSQSKKPSAAAKYESVNSKIKEKQLGKSSKTLERTSPSPKPSTKIEAKPQKAVAETHTFEEEAEPLDYTSKLGAKTSARSISRNKAKKDEVVVAPNPQVKPKHTPPQGTLKPTIAPASKPSPARTKATLEPAQPTAAPVKQTAPGKKPFRPDTMDLFSKLEEYTRYKENMDLLNHAEEVVAEGAVIEKKPKADKENVIPEKAGKQPAKKGEDAGEFLRKKITDFGKKEDKARPLPVPPGNNSYSSRVLKERSPSVKNIGSSRGTAPTNEGDLSPKRSARNYSSKLQVGHQASPLQQKTPRGATPQKSHLARSIDLKKVVEPRFRREKVELPAEPSFQPMLSRKSLILAEKMGYNGEGLWNSRTPTKQQQGHRSGSREHNSQEQGAKEHNSSPWMSRMAGGAEHPGQQHYHQGAPSFQPRICEKSKQIDQFKYRGQGPRFEVLHQLGAEQHLKLQRRMRDKAKEEDEEIKAMSFQPRTAHLEAEGMYKSGVGIADRNEQWAQRKEERIQRLKESQQRAEAEQCSFKPKLVVV